MSDLKDVKLLLSSMVSLIELLVDDTATPCGYGSCSAYFE
jgi:hypothetical protein